MREQAWPDPRDADELHDALVVLGFIAEDEIGAERLARWSGYMGQLQQARRSTRLTTPDSPVLWVAAERLAEMQMLFPKYALQPPIQAVGTTLVDDEDAAWREIIRSRCEGLGPVTLERLTQPLPAASSRVSQALLALEQEGFVIQGHFSTQQELEWCERGLLARIHRYTLKQLRNEIEPVSAAVFMSFLFHWQGLEEPAQGKAALERVMLQLEGVSAPAASWENDILSLRLQPYFSTELDELCSSGKLAWLRLHATPLKEQKRRNPAIKTTPLAFIFRSHLAYWCESQSDNASVLSSAASTVLTLLQQQGASFFDELQAQSGLLKTQLEVALGELVAGGLINSDQFQGLRAMVNPRKKPSRHRPRTSMKTPLAAGGRWSLIRPPRSTDDRQQRIQHIAGILLSRYGVVFRKLLERESGLPAWRELLYVFRRMEARGEIRGGRFVQGFSGEQFALPEAVTRLRQLRNRRSEGNLIAISAADPLNLTGIITPGVRIPAQAGNRILFKEGVPVASQLNGEMQIDAGIPLQQHWQITNLLTRKLHAASFHAAPETLL